MRLNENIVKALISSHTICKHVADDNLKAMFELLWIFVINFVHLI